MSCRSEILLLSSFCLIFVYMLGDVWYNESVLVGQDCKAIVPIHIIWGGQRHEILSL